MGAKQNKAILSDAIKKYNDGDHQALFDIIADNHIYHTSADAVLKGLDEYKKIDNAVSITFPDQQYTIEDIIAEGDMLVWRQTMHATFNGKFKDIAPTGKKVTLPAICIHRFAEGKIVETWVGRDMMSMLQQMGVMKPRD